MSQEVSLPRASSVVRQFFLSPGSSPSCVVHCPVSSDAVISQAAILRLADKTA